MARRKKNPTLGTILLVGAGAAAVVGGVGYAIYQARQPKKPKKKKIRCDEGYQPKDIEGLQVCVPIGEAAPAVKKTSNKPGKYVGAKGYTSWPFQTRYPNAQAFIDQLKVMGYNPGSSLTSSKGKSAIKDFQRDYNRVSEKIIDWAWALFGEDPLSGGVGKITVDGRLGEQTIHALVAAVGMADSVDMSWKQLVRLDRSDVVEDDEDDIVIDEEPDLFFPAPKAGLPAGCRQTIQAEVTEYVGGTSDGNVEGLVEFILDACNARDDQALSDAVLVYLYDIAEKNRLTELGDYASSLL